MNINGAVKALKIVAKSLFNKLRPAENSTRFLDESSQQLEFNGGKIQRSATKRCLMSGKINRELTKLDFIRTTLPPEGA